MIKVCKIQKTDPSSLRSFGMTKIYVRDDLSYLFEAFDYRFPGVLRLKYC